MPERPSETDGDENRNNASDDQQAKDAANMHHPGFCAIHFHKQHHTIAMGIYSTALP